ncbi:MAG: FAD:protein FMN transferase [Nocardioides sp.]
MAEFASDRTSTFRAIGTYVHLSTTEPGDIDLARELARSILADIDDTCSRFRPDSDLSIVNRHAGSWVEVDPLLIEAVRVAVEAAEHTGGLVNPLLGRTLISLGYDRDFTELVEREDPRIFPAPDVPSIDAWRAIDIDAGGLVRIPALTALDLGATAKAWAADLIARAIAYETANGGIVSVGGDIAVSTPAGVPGPAWPVAISEYPDGPVQAACSLPAGGLATSSTRVRSWRRGGTRLHHLIDPRTGHPCAEVWRTVTVIAPTCTEANTASTNAVVLGSGAPSWLERRGLSARLVSGDGSVRTIGAWADA